MHRQARSIDGTAVLAFVLLSTIGAHAQTSGQTLGPFTRPLPAPILSPQPASTFTDPITHQPIHWEALHTFNPAAIVRDGKVFVLYRAEDNTGAMQIGGHTSRLGLASSTDGLHFTRLPEPVFFPADDAQKSREWPGGVEDPRLVEAPDGTYVLTYTQYNRQTYSIGIATSPDLLHWRKQGPAFLTAARGRYSTLKYKSGGIVTTLITNSGHPSHLVAAKIKGQFWMFWGEGALHLATSPDLLHWSPVEDPATHAPIEVLTRRPGHFDSGFPEVGPPPVLTSMGILVLYNGKNDPIHGDPALGPNAYAAGEAVFAPDDPAHLLSRTDTPVLKPEEPWEKTGQYAAGTTFAEGLVLFHDKWLLFYGCADSAVGLATAPGPQ
jgi:predicted GH43/DUF377 family glycosyl hydrolase